MGDDDLFHEIRRRIDEQIPYDPGEHHIDNAARAVQPLIAERERQAVREKLDGVEAAISSAINGWRDGNRDDRRRRQGLRQALEIIAAHRESAT